MNITAESQHHTIFQIRQTFRKKAYYTSIVENLQKITLNILINHSGLTVLHVSKLFLKIQILDEHSKLTRSYL